MNKETESIKITQQTRNQFHLIYKSMDVKTKMKEKNMTEKRETIVNGITRYTLKSTANWHALTMEE